MVAALLVGGGGRRLCSGHSGRVKGWLALSWSHHGLNRATKDGLGIAMGSRANKGMAQ